MHQVEHTSTKKYAVSIVGRINEMRKGGKNCDFIIRAGSKDIPAHRSVLSAGSEYFRGILTSNTKENRSGVVELADVDFDCAKICVCHIYGEEVFILVDKCAELMFVAGMMKLQKLCDSIAAWLQEKLDLKSFYTVKSIGENYGYSDLMEKCKAFAVENLVLISKGEKFGTINKNILIAALKKVKICEEDKLDVLLKWANSCPTANKDLMEVISCIDLHKIPAHHLRYVIENESTIRRNADCLLHFSLSAMDVMKVSPKREPKSLIGLLDKESGHLQCYNPRDHTMKKMQKLNKDMMEQHFTAVTLGEHIYVLMQTRMVYRIEYALETAKWRRMSSMTEDHGWFPPATVLSNFIYVISGSHENLTTCVERYNPERNRWTKLKGKTTPLSNATPLAYGRHIYTFGGCMDGRFTGITMQYTPSKSRWATKWAQMKSMVTERGNPGVALLNGKAYVMGGYRPFLCVMQYGEQRQELECYDIATGEWTFLKSMITSRYWCRSLAIDGAIYAVGGFFGERDSMEKYNVERNEWSSIKIPNNAKLDILDAVEIKLVDC